ncbi:MAG: hypothetical protein ACP5UV_06235, partial [Thermoplasmata archaeon]
MIKLDKIKVLSIALVTIMVSSAMFSFAYFVIRPADNRIRGDLDLGPRINYRIYDDQITEMQKISRELSIINNTTISVQISGTYLGSNDTYVMANTSLQFFNGSIFLSPEFYNLSHIWALFISSHHLNMYPSLTIESYESIYRNGSLYVYSSYNNIPYNPYVVRTLSVPSSSILGPGSNMSVQARIAYNVLNGTGIDPHHYSNVTLTPYEINTSISFPDKPEQVLRDNDFSDVFNNTTSFSRYAGEYSYITYSKVIGTHYISGPLPLMIVHMSDNVAYGGSLVIYGGNYLTINNTMGTESDQVFVSSSGICSTMSTFPSYLYIIKPTEISYIESYGIFPLNLSLRGNFSMSEANNRTTGMFAIEDAVYSITDYRQCTDVYRTQMQESI